MHYIATRSFIFKRPVLCRVNLTSVFQKGRMKPGTIQSTGKSIISFLTLYKREAGDRRRGGGGSCAGRERRARPEMLMV